MTDVMRHGLRKGMAFVTSTIPGTCDVRACAAAATGRYLYTSHDQAVEFSVCTLHFDRISRGARPLVVTQQADSTEAGARPVLLLE